MANGQAGYGKVVAAGAAGAVTIVLTWVLDTFVIPGHPIPAEVGDALTTLIATGAVYWTPHDAVGGG